MNKPENMTHLNGKELVPKTDPRIALRGKLDTLQSETVLLQTEAHASGYGGLAEQLEEMLALLQALIHVDVTGEPLVFDTLFGMTPQALHDASHACYRSFHKPQPLYSMGKIPAMLNLLRAHVREAELAAAHAAEYGGDAQVQYALNRLSSALYVLFHRLLQSAKSV